MVAQDLNLSKRTVRRMCECGELPGIRLGGLWLIIAKAYFDYIENLKNESIDVFWATVEAKNKDK